MREVTGAIVVAGPRSAGVTSMIGELRSRIPGRRFVEISDIDAGVAPAAVVFVVSAVAPVTESDCVLAARATARTDTVVAVLSKIDDHRDWRGVLALNRERLAGCVERFRGVAWVAVAAAPRLGEPLIGDLVELLACRLDDPESVRRNALRAAEFRLVTEISRLETLAADRKAQVDGLRELREELLRQQFLLGAQAGPALHSRIQQVRVTSTISARNRCAKARTEMLELVEQVIGTGRRPSADIEECVLRRCREIVAEVEDQIFTGIREIAADLGLPEPPRPLPEPTARWADPPVRSGRLEAQLMAVLGAGFGLGVALLVTRLLAGLAPQATVAGLAAGGAAGLAVTVWVVRSRGLLQYRGTLDRWVGEVISALRAVAEERVASRVMAAEAVLSPAHLAGVAGQRRAVGRRIAAIDAELREHACAMTRAEAVRDSEMPSLQRALQAVRGELAQQIPIQARLPAGR